MNEEIIKQLGETWQASENLSENDLYPGREDLKTEIVKDSLTMQRDSIVKDTIR